MVEQALELQRRNLSRDSVAEEAELVALRQKEVVVGAGELEAQMKMAVVRAVVVERLIVVRVVVAEHSIVVGVAAVAHLIVGMEEVVGRLKKVAEEVEEGQTMVQEVVARRAVLLVA